MEIREPVMVRNPHGRAYWVERARLPELLAQGFVVVLDPKAAREEGQKPKRKRKAKDGGAK